MLMELAHKGPINDDPSLLQIKPLPGLMKAKFSNGNIRHSTDEINHSQKTESMNKNGKNVFEKERYFSKTYFHIVFF